MQTSFTHQPRKGTIRLRTLCVSIALCTAIALAGCESAITDGASQAPSTARTAPVSLTPSMAGCSTGQQSSGAFYEICLPEGGNPAGTLVIYAHGFVFPQQPLGLPRVEGGVDVPAFVTGRGFAYAATSYYANGLVVPEKAFKDLRELVHLYQQQHGRPERVLFFGVSNGALLATLALEKNQGLYDGAFAACGPVGDYQRQVNYLGDLFVLFQHFFPGVVPGSPEGVPGEFVAHLAASGAEAGVSPDRYLAGMLAQVLSAPANFPRMAQILSVIGNTPEIGAVFAGPQEGVETVIRAVAYNVFAAANAVETVRGNLYDNAGRVYAGSADDAALNSGIARYSADANARAQIEAHYQTKGRLNDPVVTLHTRRDPTVPFWHASLYEEKAGSDAAFRTFIPVERFGHCTFTSEEVGQAMDVLEAQTATVNMTEL